MSGHLQHPLHVIKVCLLFITLHAIFIMINLRTLQRWNGEFFERTSLKALGLRVQLGHPIGNICAKPRSNAKPFFVLHTNGIHEVAVNFCDCDQKGDAGNWRVQCLRREWFPATQKNPETCITFRVMEHYHLQTLQAKTTAYDYYICLTKLTDNTGTIMLPVSEALWPPFLLNVCIEFLQDVPSGCSGVAAYQDGEESGKRP